MKRKLWHIFGPVACACVLVFAGLLLPLPLDKPSDAEVNRAATSLNQDVLLGQQMKGAAATRGYVPFIGSSELSRMDPFHPSVLAQKYHRGYKTLLLGGPGTQSLTQFVDNQNVYNKLKNKKAVVVISPQWFTKMGQRPDAFAYYYSPLELSGWLLAKRGGVADRYAARRILQMNNTTGLIHQCLLNVAAGQKLSTNQRFFLRLQHQLLRNEDRIFSRFNRTNNIKRIDDAAKKLPNTATDAQLDTLANKMGTQASRGNDFGIADNFFDKRLRGKRLTRLQGSQANFDYRRSPEYGDMELLLHEFAKNHTQVQFIIPPVNARWADFTGLPESMMYQTVAKIEQQLRAQNFTNILNMVPDGAKKNYMTDTIHLGWRGWVDVDKTVRPFLENQQPTPKYHLSNYYFSKKWQNKVVGAN